jgi:hypothetical protein
MVRKNKSKSPADILKANGQFIMGFADGEKTDEFSAAFC